MPNKPARAKQRRHVNTMTDAQLEHLLFGWNMLDGDQGFHTEEERRECWSHNREYIMGLQGLQGQGKSMELERGLYFDFFTRPDAWWDYDAPELRRLLSGDPLRSELPPGWKRGKLGCGLQKPTAVRLGKPTIGIDINRPSEYESQQAYLLRHPELLTAAEKQRGESRMGAIRR